MTDDHAHHGSEEPKPGSFWTSKAFLVFLGFLAMAVVLLWSEHRAHILGVIPFLFLLACPLMHIFMHGGHGGHRHQDGGGATPPQSTEQKGEKP
jgi:hypothetical protein